MSSAKKTGSKRVKVSAGVDAAKRSVVHLTMWSGNDVEYEAYVMRNNKCVMDPELLAVMQTFTTRTLIPGDTDDEATVNSDDEDENGENDAREYDMYLPVEKEPLVLAGTHVALARGYRLYTFAKADFNMYPEAERITGDDTLWGAVTRATEVRRYRGGCDHYTYSLDTHMEKPYATNPETKLPNGIKNVGDAPNWSLPTGAVLVFDNAKKKYTEMVMCEYGSSARYVPKDVHGDEDIVFLALSALPLPDGQLDVAAQTRVLQDNAKLAVPGDDSSAFY
jgi:hypothetical protein